MTFKRQFRILSDRYFDCMLGDFSSLLWTLGQAPLIAMLIILRWDGWQATDTLHFVIALSVHWFGLINSCREIAKERSIFQRERLFDVSVSAYLASKAKILSMVGLVETLLFFMILETNLSLDLNPALAFSALIALYLSGMTLGLLLSAVAKTPAKAVISVPLAILPQIIFSKFILPEGSASEAAEWVAKLTPVKWGYDALRDIKSGEVAFGSFMGNTTVLLVGSVVLFLLTLIYLKLFRR